ncbi:MAG: hypothetical protein NTV34_10225 [Proteobacteria bacterium]|nr:hypothetical protein [Pseudomonadota bacterium]
MNNLPQGIQVLKIPISLFEGDELKSPHCESCAGHLEHQEGIYASANADVSLSLKKVGEVVVEKPLRPLFVLATSSHG